MSRTAHACRLDAMQFQQRALLELHYLEDRHLDEGQVAMMMGYLSRHQVAAVMAVGRWRSRQRLLDGNPKLSTTAQPGSGDS